MKKLQQLLTGTIGLTGQQFNRFSDELKCRSLKKKEHLIREGSTCDFIGIVTGGTLRSYVQNEEHEFNNDFYFADHFISAYTSFLTRSPTNCNIEALTDSQILYLTRDQLDRLIANDPGFLHLAKYISDLFFIRKCKRETSFLKNNAGERFRILCDNFPGIEQQVSQYHIASYLGIKPESLSRLKSLTYINR